MGRKKPPLGHRCQRKDERARRASTVSIPSVFFFCWGMLPPPPPPFLTRVFIVCVVFSCRQSLRSPRAERSGDTPDAGGGGDSRRPRPALISILLGASCSPFVACSTGEEGRLPGGAPSPSRRPPATPGPTSAVGAFRGRLFALWGRWGAGTIELVRRYAVPPLVGGNGGPPDVRPTDLQRRRFRGPWPSSRSTPAPTAPGGSRRDACEDEPDYGCRSAVLSSCFREGFARARF
jgi:hypothetical protein